jgi:putative membrane protein
MKRLLSVFAAGAAMFYAAGAFAQQALPQGGPRPGYGYRHMGGFMFHPLGSLFMLLLCVLIVALILRLFGFGRRWQGRNSYGRGRYGGGHGALDILEERFARGEIDQSEFEEKRKLLDR